LVSSLTNHEELDAATFFQGHVDQAFLPTVAPCVDLEENLERTLTFLGVVVQLWLKVALATTKNFRICGLRRAATLKNS
jgi:hypothetical protein